MKEKSKLLAKTVRIAFEGHYRSGAICVITEANGKKQEATVAFDNGENGDYQYHCSEMLYPLKALVYALDMNRAYFDNDDRKTVGQIIRLVSKGKQGEALSLAYSNFKINEFCLTTADNFVELKKDAKRNKCKLRKM